MRSDLCAREENVTYTGTFIRYGSLHEYGIRFTTVLIRNIKANENLVADHQWFRVNQGFENMELQVGDRIVFNADVSTYVKGYLGRNKQLKKERSVELDYQLTNLKNVSISNNQESGVLCQLLQ